jgi:putative membrane protein
MAAALAFLHHLAAFALVSAIAVEFVLLRGELTVGKARAIRLADLVYGASAAAILTAGVLRVLYFEKGTYYYFHSVPFFAKMSLFVVVGLLSVYPTLQFFSWRAALKRGSAPVVAPSRLRALRLLIHLELAALVALIACATLMARGIGYVGA